FSATSARSSMTSAADTVSGFCSSHTPVTHCPDQRNYLNISSTLAVGPDISGPLEPPKQCLRKFFFWRAQWPGGPMGKRANTEIEWRGSVWLITHGAPA